jgi:hypothetical protein
LVRAGALGNSAQRKKSAPALNQVMSVRDGYLGGTPINVHYR